MGYDLNKAPMPQEATLAQRVESLSKRNSKLQREIADLRAKLAAETNRANEAEAQRDRLAKLLREAREWVGVGLDCCDDGNWVEGAFATVERIEERIDAALAEMENQGDRDGGDIIDALNDGRAV